MPLITPVNMRIYTSLAVFLFSAISLIIPSGFSLGACLLLLGSLYLIFSSARPRLQHGDKMLIVAFLLYFVFLTASNAFHHATGEEYDAPSRFLLAIPALLLLRAFPPKESAFWGGLAAGGITAGAFSIYQALLLGIDRPGGSTNPIQYGNIAAVLSILSACGLAWAATQPKSRTWTALLSTSALAALLASFLSGSRGSWIALPCGLILACYLLIRQQRKRTACSLVLGLALMAALLWAVPNSGLKNRIALATSETSNYEHSGNADSSVGTRLEMWRIGIAMIPEHWLAGWGKQGMVEHKQTLINEGLTSPALAEHTHLHNEYLDAIVKRGVPGLLVLLVLYLLPLRQFAQSLSSALPATRTYAVCGTALIVSYLCFGLTQVFLSHNNGVMIEAFMTAILWSLLRNSRSTEINSH